MDRTPSNRSDLVADPRLAGAHSNPVSVSESASGSQLQPQFIVSPALPIHYLQPQHQLVYSNMPQEIMSSRVPPAAYTFPNTAGQVPQVLKLTAVEPSAYGQPPVTWKPAQPNVMPPPPIITGSGYPYTPVARLPNPQTHDVARGSFGQRLEPSDLQPIQATMPTAQPEMPPVHPSVMPLTAPPPLATVVPPESAVGTSFNQTYHTAVPVPTTTVPKQQKRTHLPCPEDIIHTLRLQKKPKIDADPAFINIPFSVSNDKFPPMAHSAPSSMIPIIPLKTGLSDFYTDFPKVTDPKVHEQVQNILYQFPPPLPPASLPTAGSSVVPPTAEDFRHRYMTSSEDSGLDSATPNTSPTSTPRDTTKQIPSLEGGVYVPFIYPPPPIIKQNDLPYSLTKFRENLELNQFTRDAALVDSVNFQQPPNEYPEIAPLPFPPSNYMPYPIHSDKGPLTPPEVLDGFIDALKFLPRVDMIVASAAGSLYELRNSSPDQVSHLAAKQDELRRKEEESDFDQGSLDDHGNDQRKNDAEIVEEDDDSEYGFLKHIDYQNYYHLDAERRPVFPWSSESNNNVVVINPLPVDYLSTISRKSETRMEHPPKMTQVGTKYDPFAANDLQRNEKVIDDDDQSSDEELEAGMAKSDTLVPLPIRDLIPRTNRDVVSASGNFFLRRQADLKDSLSRVESYENSQRYQIYHDKKLALLEKLSNLRKSKINFIFKEGDVLDEDLLKKLNELGVERDTELIRQKLADNYEKLKGSLQFYQDSNKAYKNLNIMMVNKLQKLKNFFEYQRKILHQHLEDKSSEIFDIKSKESSKLFFGVNNDSDYTQVIKKTMRHKSESVEPEPNDEEDSFMFDNEATPAETSSFGSHGDVLFKDANAISETLLSKASTALVHDLMPLITPAEFDLITGDLPNQVKNLTMKSKSADKISKSNLINVKHKIFQSALYDPLYTSGSDSNTSDSLAAGAGVVDRLVFNTTGTRNGGNLNIGNVGLQQSGNVSTGGSGAGSATPKRRGRRAATALTTNTGHLAPAGSKSVEDIDVSKYLEALLLAKIMKHFQGPQAAKAYELNEDLDGMGITTRWPVK